MPTVAPPSKTQITPKLHALVDYLESLHARADLATLEHLLRGVSISRRDILSFCIFGERGYRRNTISSSEWYELLALCWRSGQTSAIHDHAGSSCAFRVVEGTGTEIRFKESESGLICPTCTNAMAPGYICAAADADIHQVANMQSPGEDLITLHIYSTPIKRMNTYTFGERGHVSHEGWIDGEGI